VVTAFVPAVMIGLLVGIGFGTLYFGGLWLTIRRLPRARRPMHLLIMSWVLRMAVLLLGLGLIVRQDWRTGIGVLGGIGLVRLLITASGRSEARPGPPRLKGGDA
jgi:F1F0 ATPase subunit 2